jgi:hypothetical protein
MVISLEDDSNDLKKGRIWNKILTTVSIINIVIILHHLYTRINQKDDKNLKLIFLVMIFVFVCAIRSIWPRVDGSGLCIYNNKISTPLVGRCCATVAEICFATFIVSVTNIILDSLTNLNGMNFIIKLNYSMIILISIAQIFCWVGIITNDPSYNAIEESMWAIFGFVICVIYLVIYFNLGKFNKNLKIMELQKLAPIIIVCAFLYLLFMILVDVPMYIKRAKQNKNKNIKYNDFSDGISNMNKCRKVTSSFKEWKEDIPWLTLYFSCSVWGSIYLLKWVEKYQKLK